MFAPNYSLGVNLAPQLNFLSFLSLSYGLGINLASQLICFLSFLSLNYGLGINLVLELFFFVILSFVVFKTNNFSLLFI